MTTQKTTPLEPTGQSLTKYIYGWEWDKVYNIANDKEFELYLKRIKDVANGAKR